MFSDCRVEDSSIGIFKGILCRAGEMRMADYKLYRLDGTGQIAGAPEVIQAPTDRQAIAAARELRYRTTAELWHGTRLVARIEA